MQQHTPASISFGRRLAAAEEAAARANRELTELKQSLPNAANMNAAALAGETIQAQRKNAKRMLAGHGTTLEELNSIDPTILTPAIAEQLRLTKNSMMLSQELQAPQDFQFDGPKSLKRFENFRQASALSPAMQGGFAASNTPAEVDTPFARWDRRQKSLAGRMWNSQAQHAEYQRDVSNKRSKNTLTSKPSGKTIGGTRNLSAE